jgi:hypothetical protein
MIKKHGGIFGRNPTFNDVTVEGTLSIEGPIVINGNTFSGLDYEGAWNASTNTPTLTSSVGTLGQFYIVSVAGNTNLNGVTNWGVGDWAVFNGSVWQRVEGGADGNFVNLSVSGTATLSGGTVNGVAYLDASKAITTGSSLSFDGTNLANSQNVASPIGLVLTNSSANTAAGTRLTFKFGGSTTGYVGNQFDGADFNNQYMAAQHHIWFTNTTERMRITSTGNVGIDTGSPGAKLDVVSTSGGTTARFRNVNTGNFIDFYETNTSTRLGYVGTPDGTNWNVHNDKAGYLAFDTSNTERMRIDSSGNLGLGVTPSAWSGVGPGILELNGNAYVYSTSGVLSSGANAYFNGSNWIYKTTQAATRYEQVNGTHKWDTAPSGTAGNAISFTQAMTLDASGNLGLGVTLSAWVEPAFEMKNGGMIATAGPNAHYMSNTFYGSGTWTYTTSAAATRYTQQNGAHQWFNAPSGTAGNAITFTQAMTLDASGNLLVGTTSSVDNNFDIQINTPAAGVRGMGVNDNGGYGVYLMYDKAGRYSTDAAALRNIANTPLVFETNNTERARIPAAGGMVVGTAALATTATDGFLYVPTCAGTPTGTPTTQTGTAPIVVDTTNNKLYFYSGGQWRDAGP